MWTWLSTITLKGIKRTGLKANFVVNGTVVLFMIVARKTLLFFLYRTMQDRLGAMPEIKFCAIGILSDFIFNVDDIINLKSLLQSIFLSNPLTFYLIHHSYLICFSVLLLSY